MKKWMLLLVVLVLSMSIFLILASIQAIYSGITVQTWAIDTNPTEQVSNGEFPYATMPTQWINTNPPAWNWSVTGVQSHSSPYSIMSGAYGGALRQTLNKTVNTNTLTNITFWGRVSSGYCNFRFYMNFSDSTVYYEQFNINSPSFLQNSLNLSAIPTNKNITQIELWDEGHSAGGSLNLDDISIMGKGLYQVNIVTPPSFDGVVLMGLGLFGAILLIVAPVYAIETFLEGDYIEALGFGFLMCIIGFGCVLGWLF